MRVLVLGGSWFLGRLLVEDFARRGFEVTVFNRGRTTVSLPSGVRQFRGDRERDDDLRTLAKSGPWDVVIDVSGKVPAVVQRSTRVLAEVAERYAFVSTIWAYREWPHAPVDERSSLCDGDPDFDPGTRGWDPGTYGPLKVGCEMACRDAFDEDRLLILRSHAMVGQHEYVGALRWWLYRTRLGGPVLVPGPDRAIQPVDVRDVAGFLVDQVERGRRGIFNVAAPPDGRTYGAMVRDCAEVVAADALAAAELVWVDEDWLVDKQVRQWTELPLWCHAAAPWGMNVDRAVAAGLRCRPLADTIADTWRWLATAGRSVDQERFAEFGIDPTREAAIIAQWRASSAVPTATARPASAAD